MSKVVDFPKFLSPLNYIFSLCDIWSHDTVRLFTLLKNKTCCQILRVRLVLYQDSYFNTMLQPDLSATHFISNILIHSQCISEYFFSPVIQLQGQIYIYSFGRKLYPKGHQMCHNQLEQNKVNVPLQTTQVCCQRYDKDHRCLPGMITCLVSIKISSNWRQTVFSVRIRKP